MVADAPADSGERVSLPDQVDSFQVLFLLDELDVALDVNVGRARYFTRRVAVFQDPEDIRRSLGVMFGDCFPRAEIAVELVGYVYGAGFSAVPAGRALFLVNIAGTDFYSSFEITRFSLKADQFR